ncbi:GNAT family N-acetyltransferase [Streptomyces sp. NPDC089799]|uniref:GNAT family N-acetyltransferase n=1 Tax=Streptomyces sp. NPDC089799 TaxID=3155066 RepID=UPI00342E90FE
MIRQALPGDLDAIAALHARARATYYAGRIPEEAYAGAAELARTREGWSTALQRAQSEGDGEGGAGGGVLCSVEDGELTGVAAYRPVDGRMTLTQLHVEPAHWRRGVGTALHTGCRDAWLRAGVPRVRLDVYEHNLRAQAFYAAHGWRPDPAVPSAGSHIALWLTLDPGPAASGE